MANGIDLKRISSPGNPASGWERLYNDANGTLNYRDLAGNAYPIVPPALSAGMSSFIMSDGVNNQTINDGNTQTFTGSTAINGTVSAADTLTLNWDLTKLSSANGTLLNTDYLGMYSISNVGHRRFALADLPTITSIDTSNDLVPVVDATDNRLKLVAPTNLGSSGAPTGAQYLALATDAGLSAERVFTPGSGLAGSDGGANGAYTLNVDISPLSAIGTTDPAADLLIIEDVTDGLIKKATPYNLKIVKIAILRDEKTSGTQGGASSAATWNNRDLNTEHYDPDGIVSISSNQFTPIAGDYIIFARGSVHGAVGLHRLRLYNVTGAASVDESMNNRIVTANEGGEATLITYFTANGTDAYRIDHYTQSAVATNGLGPAMSLSVNEVYCEIHLAKVA